MKLRHFCLFLSVLLLSACTLSNFQPLQTINPIYITYLILIIAVILLLSERIRPDLVALMVVVSLGLTGVLTPAEAFSGFSASAVMTILAIFILAEGLLVTGVTDQVGRILVRIAGSRESILTAAVMAAGSLLSLIMNNIAAAAVLLPAAAGAAHKTKISSSKLLMPLAFATLLGGMATLFTTTNLVVSGLLRAAGYQGFGVLAFLPLGIPIMIAGILYMILLGRRLLPSSTPTQQLIEQTGEGLLGIYRIEERLIHARLSPESELIGKTLGNSCLRECHNLNLVAVERSEGVTLSPPATFIFKPNDVLVLEGRPEDLTSPNLVGMMDVLTVGHLGQEELENSDVMIVEALLAPRSRLIGKTLRDSLFRDKYRMNVLAIWRAGRPIRTRFFDLPLELGDALLLQVNAAQIPVLKTEPDLIVLGGDGHVAVWNKAKALPAILIMAITLILAIIRPVSVAEIMLAGAIVMVLYGILNMDQAYRAVDWKSIFLIAGMLPLGLAMAKTGASAALADGLLRLLGSSGPYVVLSGLFILTVLLTQIVNGAVVAAVIAPIAIQVAQKLGADPRSFAMAIALACSIAFITPLGHAVNVLVMGSAGYQFKDFSKVGLPLTILLIILILGLLPVFWPLFPA